MVHIPRILVSGTRPITHSRRVAGMPISIVGTQVLSKGNGRGRHRRLVLGGAGVLAVSDHGGSFGSGEDGWVAGRGCTTVGRVLLRSERGELGVSLSMVRGRCSWVSSSGLKKRGNSLLGVEAVSP